MNQLTLHSRHWIIVAAVLLLAALDGVPPGWRDDELIEIGMDTRIERGWRPLPATRQLAFGVYRDTATPGSRGRVTGDAPQVGALTIVSHTVAAMPPSGGEGILLTTWRVDGPLADSLKLFVHLLDAGGQVIGNGDRLDVSVALLRTGDVLIQRNPLPRPADAVCAPCRIELGLYNPATNERRPASTGDHIALPIEVRP
jgi:hypothetical protein